MIFGAVRGGYRLPPMTEQRRAQLAAVGHAQLMDLATALLVAEHGAGRWVHRTATRAMAHVMASTLRHGAFRVGILSLALLAGCSRRTVIRASDAARSGDTPWLYRVQRGRRGECVTCWAPTPALVDALFSAWQTRRASGRKHGRNLRRPKRFRGIGDTAAQVAPPLRSGPVQRGPATPDDLDTDDKAAPAARPWRERYAHLLRS